MKKKHSIFLGSRFLPFTMRYTALQGRPIKAYVDLLVKDACISAKNELEACIESQGHWRVTQRANQPTRTCQFWFLFCFALDWR